MVLFNSTIKRFARTIPNEEPIRTTSFYIKIPLLKEK